MSDKYITDFLPDSVDEQRQDCPDCEKLQKFYFLESVYCSQHDGKIKVSRETFDKAIAAISAQNHYKIRKK
jgi:hypothetical protein